MLSRNQDNKLGEGCQVVKENKKPVHYELSGESKNHYRWFIQSFVSQRGLLQSNKIDSSFPTFDDYSRATWLALSVRISRFPKF